MPNRKLMSIFSMNRTDQTNRLRIQLR